MKEYYSIDYPTFLAHGCVFGPGFNDSYLAKHYKVVE